MSEERTYTCLACSERPVFHGKLLAAMHIRQEHRELLHVHHPDELLSEGPVFVEPENRTGPYICLHRGTHRACGEKRDNEVAITSHLSSMHQIGYSEIVYGEHYSSVGDYERAHTVQYGDVVRPLTAREREGAERFERVMHSVSTVGDFLVECGS